MAKTTRKAIFLRNFAWLLSIWLVLMLGFSAYLMYGEKIEARRRFTEDVYSNIFRRVDSDSLWREEDFRLGNTLKSLSEFEFQTQNFCFALYAPDRSLMYASETTWFAGCYLDEKILAEGGYHAPETVFLNPGAWFSQEEIAQLVYYGNYRDDTKKVGSLCNYDIRFDGWNDDDKLIPRTVSVFPVYVTQYTEDAMGGQPSNMREYFIEIDNENSKNLPEPAIAWLYPYKLSYQSPGESRTLAAVLDGARFEERAEAYLQMRASTQIETTGLFSEAYYIAAPYHSLSVNGSSLDCDFWVVAAGEGNFLLSIWKSLLAVWLICLFVFSGAACILSHQSWQTYRKREALEQQRRDTTNAIAHDLKTPLSAISGYAENLMYGVHTEKRDYYAERIVENIRRMDGILQEMLSLARLDAGAQRVFPEALNLEALTQEAAQPYRDTLFERGVRLSVEGSGELTADRGLMLRALDNFLSNAAAHTPEDGRISIEISANRWSIENTGHPIPEDQLRTIWRAYHKADTARSHEGSGLGLSIVKAIMALHGFDCGAENTEIGVRFWFSY